VHQMLVQQQSRDQTTLEQAFNRNDTIRQKTMAEKVAVHQNITEMVNNMSYFWNPFLIDDNEEVEHMMDDSFSCIDRKRKATTTELCYQMIQSNFVGIQSLLDMLCGPSLPEYYQIKEMFMVYCQMLIGSPSESFLMALFDFNSNEDKSFDTACCTVLRTMLNILYQELLQKNNSKRIESFYSLMYCEFLSKPKK